MSTQFKKTSYYFLAFGFILAPGMLHANSAEAHSGLGGGKIESEGTFMSPADQKKIFDILVKNPASLMSDIDFKLESKLKEKRTALQKRALEKLSKSAKKRNVSKLDKINRLLDQNIKYIHEDYAWADALNDVLTQNPYLVNLFKAKEDKKSAEAELQHTKKDFSSAFDAVAAMEGQALTYDQYQTLREQYKGKPFFELMNHIQECTGCAISRLEAPFVREDFEKRVTDYVTGAHPDKNARLVITSFAGGSMFEIAVIVNKLVALGYKNILLNLVDADFKSLMFRYTQSGVYDVNRNTDSYWPFTISTQPGSIKLSKAEQDYIGNLYKVDGKYVSYPSDPGYAFWHVRQLIEDAMDNNAFAYFKQWFNGLGVNLDLVIYDSAEAYIAEAAAHPELKSDLLLAVDYYTDLDDSLNMIRKQALKGTGMAFAIDHTNVEQGQENSQFFLSVGTQKQPDMDHFEWDLKAKKLTPVAELPGTPDYYVRTAELAELFNE